MAKKKSSTLFSLATPTPPSSSSSKSILDNVKEENSEIEKQNGEVKRMEVKRPDIIWSLGKHMNLGYRDSESKLWYDKEGVRKGPPRNYWRQRMDERAHFKDMNVISRLLSMQEQEQKGVMQEMLPELLSSLGGSNIRQPSINRKQLATWVPILRHGTTLIAQEEQQNTTTTIQNDQDKNIDAEYKRLEQSQPYFQYSPLLVPYMIQMARPSPKWSSVKSPYGTFQVHLEPNEVLDIYLHTPKQGDESLETTKTLIGKMTASDTNQVQYVDRVADDTDKDNDGISPLALGGGIVYLSDYLMIIQTNKQQQQDEENNDKKTDEGPTSLLELDVWMRLDTNDQRKPLPPDEAK